MQYAETLLRAIRGAIEEYVTGPVGILFSGGLDSTVVARISSDYGPVTLYTIGTKGAHDLVVSEKTAAELDLPWNPIVLDETDIIESLLPLSRLLGETSPLPLSYEMPLYIVASRSKENALLSGQGADELFGGYARYLLMDPEQLAKGMRRDLENLRLRGVGNEKEIASHFNKRIHHPYLHPAVVREAYLLPPQQCVDGQSRKVVLKDVARLIGLQQVADRPKKAAQYGSGVMKAMKAEAKRLNVGLRDLVPALREIEKRSLLP